MSLKNDLKAANKTNWKRPKTKATRDKRRADRVKRVKEAYGIGLSDIQDKNNS